MIDKDDITSVKLRFEKILNKDKKDYWKRSSCVIAKTSTSLFIVCIVTTSQ